VYKVADRIIQERFGDGAGRSKTSAYAGFRLECEQHGYLLPSYVWFVKRVRRFVNSKSSIFPGHPKLVPPDGAPVHGDRPWEIAHIDHVLCDIELVCEDTGFLLGKPWLSVLFDAFSRRVLAFWLTFDHPSHRNCLMLMRECVRRHRRLPDAVMFDGGREFTSEVLESLAAIYGVSLQQRANDRPQFGSVIERFLGSLKTMFFANLAGTTVRNPAADPKEAALRAKNGAVWSIGCLHQLLEEFLFRIYDQRVHPSLGRSPAETYEQGLARSGMRPSRAIRYDQEFIMHTLPLTPRGVATIQPGIGFKFNRIYYWCPEMVDASLHRCKVAVRYDPFDISTTYAYIRNTWIRCLASQSEALRGRSEVDLRLASERLRRAATKTGSSCDWTTRQLAEFFKSIETEEQHRRVHLRRLAEYRLRTQRSETPNDGVPAESPLLEAEPPSLPTRGQAIHTAESVAEASPRQRQVSGCPLGALPQDNAAGSTESWGFDI
jgi:transposase InsO family protein